MLTELGIYKIPVLCPNFFQYNHEIMVAPLRFYEIISLKNQTFLNSTYNKKSRNDF